MVGDGHVQDGVVLSLQRDQGITENADENREGMLGRVIVQRDEVWHSALKFSQGKSLMSSLVDGEGVLQSNMHLLEYCSKGILEHL